MSVQRFYPIMGATNSNTILNDQTNKSIYGAPTKVHCTPCNAAQDVASFCAGPTIGRLPTRTLSLNLRAMKVISSVKGQRSPQYYLSLLSVTLSHFSLYEKMTSVGFEPTPFRTGTLLQRLGPLGQLVVAKHRISTYIYDINNNPGGPPLCVWRSL